MALESGSGYSSAGCVIGDVRNPGGIALIILSPFHLFPLRFVRPIQRDFLISFLLCSIITEECGFIALGLSEWIARLTVFAFCVLRNSLVSCWGGAPGIALNSRW